MLERNALALLQFPCIRAGQVDANSTPLANLTPKQARMYFVERIEAAQNQALNDKLDVVKDAARDLVAYYTNALQ